MTIRDAVPADLPAMMEIERADFPGSAWSEEQFRDEFERIPATRWYAVAEESGQVIGYVGLYLNAPDADVQTIAVTPLRQGNGWGRALLAAAVDAAWARGCTRLFLEVRSDNKAALALYGACGFVRMGRRPRYYPDGADAITMRLRKHEVPDLSEAVRVG